MKQVLVNYCYYETPESKKNLEYFLLHGANVLDHVKYILVVNSELFTVQVPEHVQVLHLPNKNIPTTDFCGWAYGLKNVTESKDIYCFINDTCRGPFLPSYVTNTDWTAILSSMLEGDVHLVAPIIESPDDMGSPEHAWSRGMPFAHTYMFCLTLKALQILQANNILVGPVDKIKTVTVIERAVSALLLRENLNLKCLLCRGSKNDWRNRLYWSKVSKISDPEVPMNYDGMDVHPYEIIFVKNIKLNI